MGDIRYKFNYLKYKYRLPDKKKTSKFFTTWLTCLSSMPLRHSMGFHIYQKQLFMWKKKRVLRKEKKK